MQARPNLASPITFNESNKLRQDIEHSKITYDKALERIDNICSDIETIINRKSINLNQVEVINTLFMVDEILPEILRVLKQIVKTLLRSIKKIRTEKQKTDEQPDMPDLESEESAVQRRNQSGQGLIPNQMLSRLPIALAQLKAGNNSQKLKNEIRQLLYSLYRSEKLTKDIYNHLINAI